MKRVALAALVWLTLALVQQAGAAQPDVAGSSDPYGLSRVPRSWIVEYADDDDVRPRQFITSRVDRVRRDMLIEDALRIDATLRSTTYQVPDGVTVGQVVDHYSEVLGDDVLFRCQGRDCGRSNDWANQVFEQAILYGPDRNQRYLAWQWQGRLVSLYAIERGNKRVYAHLQFLDPRGSLAIEPNSLLVQRLTERGWATVESVTPLPDGGFPDSAREVLAGLAEALQRFAGETMYLVCHLYGADGGDALLTASQSCAETGVELIVAGADTSAGGPVVQLQPFGAGSLLPRGTPPDSRLEIVLPALASSQGD